MTEPLKLEIPVLGELKPADLAPAPAEDLKPTPELNPRLRAEKEIAERAGRQRDEEAKERIPGMDPAPESDKPEDPSTDASGDTTPAPASADAPSEPAPDAVDEEIELIVNGKPIKVRRSQVLDAGVRAMQKDSAADLKLELASRLLKEAEERAGKQPPAYAGAPPPSRDSQPAVQEKSDSDLAELIQYGTKEQAASAISEIRRRDKGSVNQEGLEALITQRLPEAVSAQLAFHEAVRTARSEYADIFADPHLTTLFHVQEHQARQAGDVKPHAELYKTIGDGIRSHFKLKAPTPNTGPTLADKKDAKAAAPSLPRTASARIDPRTEVVKTREQARDDTLEKMAKARGQGSISKYK